MSWFPGVNPFDLCLPIGLPRSIVCEHNMHIGSVLVLIDDDTIWLKEGGGKWWSEGEGLSEKYVF